MQERRDLDEAAPQTLGRAWVAGILTVTVLGVVLILAAASGAARRSQVHEAPSGLGEATPLPDDPGAISVPPPPFQTDEALDSLEETGKPCSGCHNDEDLEPNPERRELDTHDDIVLQHDQEHRWCLDCHDTENRDKLRLASGQLIDFTESYKLCGQCHGDKYRDWRAGIHGRRTGRWDGKKEYRLCVHCHWAHAPAWKPIEPRERPRRPGEIR